MDRKNSPAEVYLQDISVKLTDSVNSMGLSCIVSDEHRIFFIFNTTNIREEINTKIDDDLDEINLYLQQNNRKIPQKNYESD